MGLIQGAGVLALHLLGAAGLRCNGVLGVGNHFVKIRLFKIYGKTVWMMVLLFLVETGPGLWYVDLNENGTRGVLDSENQSTLLDTEHNDSMRGI